MRLTFLGAAGEVTGSMYLIDTGQHRVLLECGMFQGGGDADTRNRQLPPLPLDQLDAVVISHAHIDHSGRIPLLARMGYRGPIYAHNATRALCGIMLPDSGYLNEKDAEWENKKRESDEPRVEPIYTRDDAERCLALFEGRAYGEPFELVPGLTATFHDAGHILGSAIVEMTLRQDGTERTLVFSGDLGYRDAPVMDPPARLGKADTVLMESTYGDRLHRPFDETIEELTSVFNMARAAQGNILIPAFTVGRAQDLLYLMSEHYDEWGLDHWQVILDSPMGIEATGLYSVYRHLYGAKLFRPESNRLKLRNFQQTLSTEQSMLINEIHAGAIIIAGSGMMSGGRIHHHLKYNIWRPECHVVVVGYQAEGTLGRRIVDGAETIRLWGETYRVRARVHTIGGLSAHADQADLVDWYGAFENRPPLYLVHGEPRAQEVLARRLREEYGVVAQPAEAGRTIEV